MGTSPNHASTGGDTKSPKQSNNATPPRQNTIPEVKQPDPSLKPDADGAKPLGPPPRPGQTTGNTPDYFGAGAASLSLEPNPFEQSFGGGAPETPGGTKLPSVAALTSPSSLLPGSGATPFNWGGGSLRTGPLSPAMLSGPTSDYFSDTHHLRGGFPTPNESSLRTGLTPGGSGSMFPAPSPNSQQLFAQLASGGATPSTIDFHRTALSAAAKRDTQAQNQNQNQNQSQPQNQTQNHNQQQAAVTSQPQEMPNGATAVKTEAKQFDPHDNDAANGLFMLAQGAQGRNGAPNGGFAAAQAQSQAHPPPPPAQGVNTSPQMSANGAGSVGAGSSVRGVSEGGSAMSDESEQARPAARGKGKRNSTGGASTNGRRKAEEPPAKAPAAKKSKPNNNVPPPDMMGDDSQSDDDDMKHENGEGGKSKMTDEEKRKNFLERNRVAALKCRQRKKQWLANLQSKVELFSSENDALTAQITQLREEVVNLKTLLLAHKDCPVTQQQGLHGAFMQQAMEPFNPQMNPYGMAAPIPNQQVLAAGQGVQRRFS
ncbi:bZIP transcription factor [Colletotrichum paranaense]|uniref:BZIP transcription factor n=2 Tax=Colletotrichum acutatum species complex TaxID=2707335 RepID=A0AAI9V426_9PEZI|nr:bZIP transcription factor [Colletotrichum paranaense]KAK1468965.1 bZIP transcription factor [Colletotrichum melonis]KAK1543410.1 bZIP transcription factor [Colletotrichum paranaense]